MRNKGLKTRCTKQSLPKFEGVCKTFDKVQTAAAIVLSFPPEMPTTALQPGPFFSKNSRIHATQSFFTFSMLPPPFSTAYHTIFPFATDNSVKANAARNLSFRAVFSLEMLRILSCASVNMVI